MFEVARYGVMVFDVLYYFCHAVQPSSELDTITPVIRIFFLGLAVLLAPAGFAQSFYMNGAPLGAGLSIGYMAGENVRLFASSVGLAFEGEFDAGILYGSMEVEHEIPYSSRRRTEEASAFGFYLGFTPTPASWNAFRLRVGANAQWFQVSSPNAFGERTKWPATTVVGIDVTAARPFGGSVFVQPSVGGALTFALSSMTPSQSIAASLGLGLRGRDAGGVFLFEPMVMYEPSEAILAVGAGLTLAVGF